MYECPRLGGNYLARPHHRVESRVLPRYSLSHDYEIRCPTAKLILDPFMIHELFPFVTEPAFRSHPCRVVSATYRKLSPFHHWILFSGVYGLRPMGSDGSFGLAPNLVPNMEFKFFS